MAQVIWSDRAARQLEAHIDYALMEFGRKAVNNWYKDIKRIEARLALQPQSYTIEQLLAERDKVYRGATLMKNFKLIHYYDETAEVVYIDAIWDMRMHPSKLSRLVE
ncbi:MAG: type II toxin-antitoxin system RelE/ParE family toxin [Prevotella sp.]|nr:type II toxin-antitoxin system RelE/ParE family toxin [Prevotella sp.]